MNLKQFKYVLTLANEGSFSRAAEVLNIKQPSLSQYIKKIETETGMQLFDRAHGEVRLTDAGRTYIEIGRKMCDLEHQLEGKFSDLAAFKTGTISVGISAHRSVALMPPVVKAFRERYPGVTLQIVERGREDLLEAAAHGEFDLVITTLPIDKNLFNSELVFVEENVVASTLKLKAAPMKGRRFPTISVSDLDGMPFAMLNEGHLMQRELDDLIRSHDIHLVKTVECTSLEALSEMAKEGIGAAFIPECLAKNEKMHYYSIKEFIPKREIVLIYRKEQYLSRAVLDLKRIIHEVLT